MREYLLSVTAAALLVSLVAAFSQRKSIQRVVALCGGLLLLLTVLRPVIDLRTGDAEEWFSRFRPDGSVIDGAVKEGQKESARLITERTQEYILDKAEALGAQLSVQVTLRALSGSYQYPYTVILTGTWTQAQKQALSEEIARDLGIPEERQIWNEAPSP